MPVIRRAITLPSSEQNQAAPRSRYSLRRATGLPVSATDRSGMTCSKQASNMSASFVCHQRYRVAVLTPAPDAISWAATALISFFLRSLYADFRMSCLACSLLGRPRARRLIIDAFFITQILLSIYQY